MSLSRRFLAGNGLQAAQYTKSVIRNDRYAHIIHYIPIPTCNVYLYRGTDYCYIINVFTKLKKNPPCPIQDGGGGGGGMQPRHDHNIRHLYIFRRFGDEISRH